MLLAMVVVVVLAEFVSGPPASITDPFGGGFEVFVVVAVVAAVAAVDMAVEMAVDMVAAVFVVVVVDFAVVGLVLGIPPEG